MGIFCYNDGKHDIGNTPVMMTVFNEQCENRTMGNKKHEKADADVPEIKHELIHNRFPDLRQQHEQQKKTKKQPREIPETHLVSLDQIFPGFKAWVEAGKPVPESMKLPIEMRQAETNSNNQQKTNAKENEDSFCMAVNIEASTYTMIPLDRIVAKLHVRRLSQSGLDRIKSSIERNGFLENYPLTVVALGDGTYQLVDGNHRYEAAKELGLTMVPCVITDRNENTNLFRLALESNKAAETIVPSTLVTYAEFIWARIEEEDEAKKRKYTLSDIGNMLGGWQFNSVSRYALLNKIDKKAWSLISSTFDLPSKNINDDVEEENSPTGENITPGPFFTERLLRPILDLTPEQQLELVEAFAHPDKNQRITKGKFKELAKAYKVRNQMKDYAQSQLGSLGETYLEKAMKGIESGAYDSEWLQSQDEKSKQYGTHPKLDKLLKAIYDEWEEKNSIHLVCGDFHEEVLKIGDGHIDLIITDPPYNIANEREFALEGRSNISQDFGTWDKYDHQEFIREFHRWCEQWHRILREGGSGYVFTSDVYISHLRDALEQAGFTVKSAVVWHKTNPAPQFEKTTFRSTVEYILFFVKGDGYTFHWMGDGPEMHNFIETPVCSGKERLVDEKKNVLHPTQKPLSLIQHLMEISSNRGDTVFDGFAGVGTTGEAAKRLGCKFHGIEKEEKFFDAMKRRLTDE